MPTSKLNVRRMVHSDWQAVGTHNLHSFELAVVVGGGSEKCGRIVGVWAIARRDWWPCTDSWPIQWYGQHSIRHNEWSNTCHYTKNAYWQRPAVYTDSVPIHSSGSAIPNRPDSQIRQRHHDVSNHPYARTQLDDHLIRLAIVLQSKSQGNDVIGTTWRL